MRFLLRIFLISVCAVLLFPAGVSGEEGVELPPVSFPLIPPYNPSAPAPYEKAREPVGGIPREVPPQAIPPLPSGDASAGTAWSPSVPMDASSLPLLPFGDLYAPPEKAQTR